MDSKEEDDVRVNVKELLSAFREKELSGMSADSKYKGKRSKSPQSTTSGSVSMRSEKSIEPPLVFKGKQLKSPQWTTSGSVSMRSEKSIEPPFVFKGKQSTSPQSTASGNVSMRSEKSIEPPFVFKDKQLKSPQWTTSGSVSMRSKKSIEPPFVFKDKQEWRSYGMPQAWGGRVLCPIDQPRLNSLCPPSAVYPVVRTDHRVPDDVIHSREKVDSPMSRPEPKWSEPSPPDPYWDYAGTAESNITSDTSDYSGSRDSQFDEETAVLDDIHEEVICDICSVAPAMKTCLTCSISYCEYDVRPHYKVKVLQRHTLIDVTAEFEGKRCHHSEEVLDIFCRTDLMPICRRCAQESHKGHDIILQTMQHAARQMCGADENQDRGLPGTVVPPPGKIKFLSIKPNSVVLNWGCPTGVDGPMSFRVKWNSFQRMEEYIVIKGFHRIEINNLEIGQQYFFSVATEDKDGNRSEWVKESVFTAVPAPRHLTKEHSEATALSLKWTKGDKLEKIPHRYLITVTSPEKEPQAIHTEDCYKMFSDLEPDTDYTISVLTVLNSHYSEPVSTTIHTDPCLMEVLSQIGLEDQYENKLTPSTVLEINHNDTSESNLETAKSLPWAFLKKLMMLNANARSVKCLSCDMDSDKSNAINPLDLITALFLCSDSFFQQDIVQKMSLCQFAVPLLLPNSETREITMMLWAMREIVRTFRPSKEAFRKLNCEERLVHSDIPLVSFVRLGKMLSSKSEMLNKLLSNNQQQNDTFYHRHMVCGDVPRRISNGLVEISWYLPCGNRNIDIFTEPVAIANLRGDIRAFDKQFSFLCETSTAVYIFWDESEAGALKSLEGRVVKARVFLISSKKGKNFTLKMMTLEPSLKTTNLSKKKTDAELMKVIQESISKMLERCPDKVQLANLADKARCNGILVDEHTDECQSARKNVDKITTFIANTSEFKDEHLRSQGNIWKAISWLEKEWWRLRKVGNQNIENYRKSLEITEKKFRTKQHRFEMTAAMLGFLNGVSTSEVPRYYFLKWLEIDLDNLSRQQLSALQAQYKQKCLTFPKEKEQMEEIDKQMYACSLHLKHFFRECGQLYECASYLPEYSCQRKTMEQLPALCAQMLLDGFSIELVDGDAANIPMKWITEVLTELHNMMNSKSKLKVIAVIGAENSGKSTLLNTMFGVKFATSRGSCSRGAFIQLINVNIDVREELKCDCILIIDTEGLKPHQKAQEDHSHERDREVASLAVALSDATIVSVSRDNSREEDILNIVLHAFTRLKDVGNKPLCHFVHTNMSDMPPVERKERDQELVEQLNEMIQKDTNLTKANITKISDVMEFDPDFCSWYLPAVWSGTPPMAPFSVEYSETVYALKKQLIGDLKKCQERGDLTHFAGRIECFWKDL
ncbi:up-regulator of cell proliferation-like isoform X2 [Scomber scombrus]|uniref:up-regulator of cell proliferation-like isoform X2 n=1 Tax=Scomber scombrus TaxID=13677 RepID=UPI002DD9813A|nr:up-regulator of cell proliferation-like isoform X2 [Scomber scombrus]